MNSLLRGPHYDPAAHYTVKSAIFDIDNTLVGNNSRQLPSERFRQAVAAARGSVKVGLATARPLAKVAHILDYLGIEGYSVLFNGAQIIDSVSRKVVAEWALSLKTCQEVIDHAQSLSIAYWINDNGEDYFPSETNKGEYEKLSDIWNKKSSRVVAEGYNFNKPFVIVLHNITSDQAAEMRSFVEQHNDNDVALLVAHETRLDDGSKVYDVFVVHKLANKRDAMRHVLELQGLSPTNTMAVGDGRNDAVLLESVGVGVAMGNSAKQTLAMATFITASRKDDGAALALECALRDFEPVA